MIEQENITGEEIPVSKDFIIPDFGALSYSLEAHQGYHLTSIGLDGRCASTLQRQQWINIRAGEER